MVQLKATKATVDLRFVIVALLVVILALIGFWRPWQRATSDGRTIDVTGSATVKAEPDEYSFNPYYESSNASKQQALDELNKKAAEITGNLKGLGVQAKQIKSNVDGYDRGYISDSASTEPTTYTLTMTVTISDQKLVQKVQDYLVTTEPKGSVSPQATYSQTKRKALESQARDEATKDARSKADQSGKNLGFSIGKVKSVNDGTGFGGYMPYEGANLSADSAAPASTKSTVASLAVQPGENELNYSVSVTYYLK